MLSIFDNFLKFVNFWKFLTILSIFDNFWQFWQFLTIFKNFDNFLKILTIFTIFDTFLTIFTILTIFECFQIFGKFSDFWGVFRVFESFCDLRHDTWDTDYISDNWEQQYGQLHCDLWIESDGDSIRNSCNVYRIHLPKSAQICPNYPPVQTWPTKQVFLPLFNMNFGKWVIFCHF